MDMKEKRVEIMADLDCHAEYCKDCEFGNDIDGCVRRQKEIIADRLIANSVTVQDNTEISEELLKQLKNAPITILQEEPTIEVVQEWISVKDRLPDCADTVIAVDRCGIMSAAYYVGYWHGGGDLDEYAVTHWMPLPPAPKGE